MQKVKVIYLLGSGHCGSTLIDLIMDGHSKIFGCGELFSLNFSSKNRYNKEPVCTCGKNITECSFWNNFQGDFEDGRLKIYRSKKDFILDKKRYYYVKDRERVNNREYVNIYKNLYKKILDLSGKKSCV